MKVKKKKQINMKFIWKDKIKERKEKKGYKK